MTRKSRVTDNRTSALEFAKTSAQMRRDQRAKRIEIRVKVSPELYKQLAKLASEFDRTIPDQGGSCLAAGIECYFELNRPHPDPKPMEQMRHYDSENVKINKVEWTPSDEDEMAENNFGMPSPRRKPFSKPHTQERPPTIEPDFEPQEMDPREIELDLG